MSIRTAIGQDSHRFAEDGRCGNRILGGVYYEDAPALEANSDGDVVYHALTNAISGITCKNILGKRADGLCENGITDSSEYVKEGMRDLMEMGYRPVCVSFSVECRRPKISPLIPAMRENIAALLDIMPKDVGITATTGEELTAFGRGEGIGVFCILTAESTDET